MFIEHDMAESCSCFNKEIQLRCRNLFHHSLRFSVDPRAYREFTGMLRLVLRYQQITKQSTDVLNV